MGLYIGVDAGTTTLSTALLDTDTGQVLAYGAVAHGAHVTTMPDRAGGRSELDLERLRQTVVRSLAELAARAGRHRGEIRGLGVTGQMHGVALLDQEGNSLGPAITWQDQRALELFPGTQETYLQRFVNQAGGLAAFERMGCLPATGYLGPTLYWLKHNDGLPTAPSWACLIPDAVVAFLTGHTPCTDPTDAGSTGVFDIVQGCWDEGLIHRLGLPLYLFPPVCPSGQIHGPLQRPLADATGLPNELPVCVALGDNQASFLGSVRDPSRSLLINVGTGAQVSGTISAFQYSRNLDTRIFPGDRYLLVGATLCGGESYALWRRFFAQVGQAFFGAELGDDPYETMNRLAGSVPAGADGLRCVPTFGGTRGDPTARGSLNGLSTQNLTPGHMVRALLEGMVDGFYELYQQMEPWLGERTFLVGSGNALRRNPLLGSIVAGRFELPLQIPVHEEEAAVGAALMAAVGTGEVPDLDQAGHLIRYQQP